MSALAQVTKPAAQSTHDLDLVAAVRAGDDRAFELLFARYQTRIAAYVRGMVRDHGRAEDITQEVFIAALRRIRETDREIAFKPWIYEIAKNACIDAFRRSRNTSEVSLDAEDALGPSDHGRLAAPGGAPDDAIETKLSIDNLCGAFGGLSQQHHDILVMREFEGLSYREIGERLGMSRAGVESTLFRARRRLSEEYEELVSGERCLRVRAIADASGGRVAGLRDKRRLARHISHCQPCRRYAIAAGIDVAAVRVPAVASKIAALLPLPTFLRRRMDPEHVLNAHSSSALNIVTTIDPSTASVWSKAVATAATVAVAGLGAGAAVKHEAVGDFISRAPSIVGLAPSAPAAKQQPARLRALEQAASLVRTERAAIAGEAQDAGAGTHESGGTTIEPATGGAEPGSQSGDTSPPDSSAPSSASPESSEAPAAGAAGGDSAAESTGAASGSTGPSSGAGDGDGLALPTGDTPTDLPAPGESSLQPPAGVPDGLHTLLGAAGTIGSNGSDPAPTRPTKPDITLPATDGLSVESVIRVLPLDPKPTSGGGDGPAVAAGGGSGAPDGAGNDARPGSGAGNGNGVGTERGSGAERSGGDGQAQSDGGGAGRGAPGAVDVAARGGEGADGPGGTGRRQGAADPAGGAGPSTADAAGGGSTREGADRVHDALRPRDVVAGGGGDGAAGSVGDASADAANSRQSAARAVEALRRNDLLAAADAAGLSAREIVRAAFVIALQRPDLAAALRGDAATARAARAVVLRLLVVRELRAASIARRR